MFCCGSRGDVGVSGYDPGGKEKNRILRRYTIIVITIIMLFPFRISYH